MSCTSYELRTVGHPDRVRPDRVRPALVSLGAAVMLAFFALPANAQVDQRECDKTQVFEIALPDAGGLYYRRVGLTPEYAAAPAGPEWRQAGLYGSGQTTRPLEHETAGIAIAQGIAPINNRIVMVSIGMSNTYQEFGRFDARAAADPAVNPDLTIVNGAQGSRPADVWTSPTDATWDELDQRLSNAGLTPDQVQIAWIKHAVRSPMFPPLDFPDHPETLQAILEDVIKALKVRYPNCVLTYVSSRTRAYNTNQAAQSPEPASYENGFAVQWMIERQIAGDADLRYEGADPPAPWLSWGPYLWTDGTGAPEGDPPSPFDARSDGLIWTCADVDRDGVHPSPPTPDVNDPNGEFKVGDQLMAFFLTDVTTTPWFLGSVAGGPVLSSVTANGLDAFTETIAGAAPFAIDFAASASGAVAGTTWTYDDGTFSYQPLGTNTGSPYFDDNGSPTKVFEVPGTYEVRLNIRDTAGNSTLFGFPVVVSGVASSIPDALPAPPSPAGPSVASTVPLALSVAPNPSTNSVTLRISSTEATVARLRIFDSVGRVLREWDGMSIDSASTGVLWDRTDQNGNAVPAGTYFVRLDDGQHVAHRTLQLLHQ